MAVVQLTSSQLAVERWKPIPGWEGYYDVSDMGRIRSLPRVAWRKNGASFTVRGRIRKLSSHPDGHRTIALTCPGVRDPRWVHRLVMAAFVGPCPEGLMVCHNNGDPTDNRLVNLRYDTGSGNMLDRRRHGTDVNVNKTHCPQGHLLAHPNLVNRRFRKCLACARAHARVHKHPDLNPHFKEIADSYFEAIMRDAEPPAA